MKNSFKSTKTRPEASEKDVDSWLKGTDLASLSPRFKFKRMRFSNLKPTNWEKLYQDFQKSRPISIRLPIRVIDKLKQVSLQKGIGYQALIRLWVTEKLQ